MHWPCIRRGDVGDDGVDVGGVGAGPAKAGPDSEMRKDSNTASGSITIRSLTTTVGAVLGYRLPRQVRGLKHKRWSATE